MTSKILELEVEILDCWSVIDHIDTLYEEVLDGDPTMDNISNVLCGLSELYKFKFNKLLRNYNEVVEQVNNLQKENGRLIDEVNKLSKLIPVPTPNMSGVSRVIQKRPPGSIFDLTYHIHESHTMRYVEPDSETSSVTELCVDCGLTDGNELHLEKLQYQCEGFAK